MSSLRLCVVFLCVFAWKIRSGQYAMGNMQWAMGNRQLAMINVQLAMINNMFTWFGLLPVKYQYWRKHYNCGGCLWQGQYLQNNSWIFSTVSTDTRANSFFNCIMKWLFLTSYSGSTPLTLPIIFLPLNLWFVKFVPISRVYGVWIIKKFKVLNNKSSKRL